ncbi:MAG: di-heme enzyme [Gemmatimonadaceae bacterium]|nr:di-heme enzyme [Gemmatimonadaceae bacterium]
MSLVRTLPSALLLLPLLGCGGDELFSPAAGRSSFDWQLPPGFPTPVVPADNPMSAAKVDLGRHLFYDRRLSGNGTQSCASCHLQSRAFTDGRVVGIGSTGERHPRNSMSIANVGYASVLNWGNPNLASLEQQALLPMFGESPVELGLAGMENELLARLQADSVYGRLFRSAFPERPSPVSVETITKALASFQRSLISGDSPYDRYKFRNDRTAMSASALRGEALFFSEETECFHCHAGVMFSASTEYVGKAFREQEYFNNGLYNVGGTGAYPADNTGLKEFTGLAADMGSHKAPTLRNIAVTAPYMHDGSIATLGEVIDHYARGGRLIREGPHAGDGALSPFKNGFVKGFTITPQEKADLIAFLESLTDSTLLTSPRFANPWRR